MIEDLNRQRIFTGDHQIENLSGACGAFGNILTLELLQIGLSCFLSHREKNIADKLWSAGTPAGGPHHLSSPARLKQVFISLRKLVRLHTAGVVTQGHEIDVGAAPEALSVF